MKAHQSAVDAHGNGSRTADPAPQRVVVIDGLDKRPQAKRGEIPATCLAGFQRTFVFKRRFVPLSVSRFLARFR